MQHIYGPVIENGIWRIRHNQEIDEILKHEDIIRFIKTQRLHWLGYLEQTDEQYMLKKILKAEVYKIKKRGHPRTRWMDDVLQDLKSMGVRGYMEETLERSGCGGKGSHWAVAPEKKMIQEVLHHLVIQTDTTDRTCVNQVTFNSIMVTNQLILCT